MKLLERVPSMHPMHAAEGLCADPEEELTTCLSPCHFTKKHSLSARKTQKRGRASRRSQDRGRPASAKPIASKHPAVQGRKPGIQHLW